MNPEVERSGVKGGAGLLEKRFLQNKVGLRITQGLGWVQHRGAGHGLGFSDKKGGLQLQGRWEPRVRKSPVPAARQNLSPRLLDLGWALQACACAVP